jgi:hypothetical protein
MLGQSITLLKLMIEEASSKGHNTLHKLRPNSRVLFGRQRQGAEALGFGGRFGDQPRKIYCLFCGEDKGHTTRMCHVTIQKQATTLFTSFGPTAEFFSAASAKGQRRQGLRGKVWRPAKKNILHVLW